MPSETKVCRNCEQELPVDDFRPRRRVCRNCERARNAERNRARYWSDPEYRATQTTKPQSEARRKAARRYRSQPEVREKRRQYARDRYASAPEYREKRRQYARQYQARKRDIQSAD